MFRPIRVLATALVATITAWSSYWHMVHVALRYGERSEVAYVLPGRAVLDDLAGPRPAGTPMTETVLTTGSASWIPVRHLMELVRSDVPPPRPLSTAAFGLVTPRPAPTYC